MEASNIGFWVIGATSVLGLLTSMVNLFATRREVEMLQERVKTLEGRIDQIGKDVSGQSSAMPSQLIALLRNTGAIHTHDR